MSVFAHTNGSGDFVLLDSLGWPWPVHDCYINRFCWVDSPQGLTMGSQIRVGSHTYFIREDSYSEYKKAEPPIQSSRQKNITRCRPEDWLQKGRLSVAGYIQDIVENRLARLMMKMGELAQQVILKGAGNRKTQITIIDEEFKSYTAFADLGNVVLSKGSIVRATMKPINALGLGPIFVCSSLEVLDFFPDRACISN